MQEHQDFLPSSALLVTNILTELFQHSLQDIFNNLLYACNNLFHNSLPQRIILDVRTCQTNVDCANLNSEHILRCVNRRRSVSQLTFCRCSD